MIKQRVWNLLAQITLGPAAGQTLIERLESGAALNAEERHHMREVVRATQACQQLLAQPNSAAQPAPKCHAKYKRQEAKAARRRNRREGLPGVLARAAVVGSTR